MPDAIEIKQQILDAIAEQRDEAAEASQNIRARLVELEQRAAAPRGDGRPDQLKSSAPVAEFIKSSGLQALQQGAQSSGRVTLKHGGIATLRTKAITGVGAGQTGDTGYDVQPQRDPNLWGFAQRKLTLLDALPSIPVTTGAFEYSQLLDYVNAAAVQAKQGDTKSEQAVNSQIVTANIATIAAFVRSSLQILDDAPALAQQLDNLLNYGARARLEAQLILGAGGAGQIKGLAAYATAFAADATAPADRIGESLDELDTNGWGGSLLIVMAPKAWGGIKRERATGGDGQYVMGSPRSAPPSSLWGVPVVTSPAVAIGSAYVMDASQLAVLDRQEIVVATSREDGNNFTTNMVTTLAELRAGLAVFSPGALLSVDLAAA